MMKPAKYIFISLLFLMSTVPNLLAQDAPVVLQRTPEQEAAKQTEKLQQELNLTQDQTRKVYEINLRYARARQVSNTRSEAMERMKNKNADLERVLTVEQNDRLQTKRYERTNYDPNTTRMTTQTPTQQTVRQQGEYRQAPVRVPAGTQYQSTYRQGGATTVTPPSATYRAQSAPQTVRREPSTPQSGSGYSAPSSGASQPQSAPTYRSGGSSSAPSSSGGSRSSESSSRSTGNSSGGRR